MTKERSPMAQVIFPITVLVVAVFILVRYLEGTAVFFPSKELNTVPSQMGLPYEDLYLTTSDHVRINAWFIKNPRAASTIIFAHGNAGNIGDRLIKAKFFYDLGLNVMLFDYRGYGKSEGKPSEQGIYLDIQAVYGHLTGRKDIDPDRIIAYGSSLGGVVAVDLASRRPVALLIVDSSITSAREAARLFYPYLPSFLMKIKFDSLAKIKGISTLKLFMHSPDDGTIPYAMGRRLFESAPEPKEFITSSGGHNEIQIVSDHKTADAFRQFLVRKGFL